MLVSQVYYCPYSDSTFCERRALGILQRQIGSALIKLEEHRGLAGRTLVEGLIAQLSARDLEQDGQGAAGPLVN
jgi:hypothetical protein